MPVLGFTNGEKRSNNSTTRSSGSRVWEGIRRREKNMEEDERKEALMASNHNFKSKSKSKSKSNGVTQKQLAKFRELQRRRLQIKTKSKGKKKHKCSFDGKGKVPIEDLSANESPDKNMSNRLTDPCQNNSCLDVSNMNEVPSSSSQDDVHPALKKKKLHWGLDTKERWERKANM